MLDCMIYATYPFEDPDSEACEIYGLILALRNGIAPLHVITDCANLERDIRSGQAFCTRHEHAYAHVWQIAWRLLDDHGAVNNGRLDQTVVRVTWTSAHTTWETASAHGVLKSHWTLNRWADKGAKWEALGQVPRHTVTNHIEMWEGRCRSVARWIGATTAKANGTHLDHTPTTKVHSAGGRGWGER